MKQKFWGPPEAHSMGGKASAAKLTPEQRSAKARKAVLARYAGHIPKPKPAKLTPAQRSERAKRRAANIPTERWREMGLLAAQSRWGTKAKSQKAA